MSLNRENVIWKSEGKWYIGFFSCWVTGEDYEWDVDYDFSSFEWASGPHESGDEAMASWPGANPGGHTVYEEGGEKYDQMFQDYQAAREAKARSFYGQRTF